MKKKCLKTFVQFLKDEEGQTSTEYILMVAIVVMIILRFRKKLVEEVNKLIDGSFSKTKEIFQDQ